MKQTKNLYNIDCNLRIISQFSSLFSDCVAIKIFWCLCGFLIKVLAFWYLISALLKQNTKASILVGAMIELKQKVEGLRLKICHFAFIFKAQYLKSNPWCKHATILPKKKKKIKCIEKMDDEAIWNSKWDERLWHLDSCLFLDVLFYSNWLHFNNSSGLVGGSSSNGGFQLLVIFRFIRVVWYTFSWA